MNSFCSKLAQAGSFSHGDGVHFHMSLGKTNATERFKDLSLSHDAYSLEDKMFASTSVVNNVLNMFGFNQLHN